MFNKFLPDIYQKSIYAINYNKLKNYGIKCIIFDLDNTISPVTLDKPTRRLKKLFIKLKNLGFKCVIVSNSGKKRVEPFKNELSVDSSFSSKKPKNKKFLKVMNNYGFKEEDICLIGDQLIPDVYGANKMGFTSILVNKMGKKDFFNTKFNRFLENRIYSSFRTKDLLVRGRYYD